MSKRKAVKTSKVEYTLNAGQSFRVGDVSVTVIDTPGSRRARLGFEAPKDVKIMRAELNGKETWK